MKTIVHFKELETSGLRYWGWVLAFGALVALGAFAAHHMEHHGHYVTGMTNQIVWGTPHVFAVFLIVAASGILNVASIASVFGKYDFKPLARLSGLMAITLLASGLIVLVLDLGRPDRLIVAMTSYNFKSIFAWNIFLYTGFMGIVAVYLWVMMERQHNWLSKPVGLTAFIWRLALTTGTGSIFGFLVARQAYDAAIMAPMFIVMSFAFGLAIYLLALMGMFKIEQRELGDQLILKLKNLLGVFIAGVFYFVLAQHLTNLYATEHHGVEAFILLGANGGGVYAAVFWIGQILLGTALPLALLYHPATGTKRHWIATAAGLVILGGLAQLYVIIIGGQAYPLELFPGYEVIESSFFDGGAAHYAPSIWEVLLGIGGIGLAATMTLIAVKVLRFLPESLDDKRVRAAAAGEAVI